MSTDIDESEYSDDRTSTEFSEYDGDMFTDIDHELLFVGYFRELHQNNNITMHQNLQSLIISYYPLFVAYGIGLNKHCEFGFHYKQQESNKFTKLQTLSHRIANVNDIYCNDGNIFVRTVFDEIYVAGTNLLGQLGFSSYDTQKNVTKFKKIEVEAIDDDNDCVDLVSNGIKHWHNFIYTANDQLFVTGANYRGQNGNGKCEKYPDEGWKNISTMFIKDNSSIIDIECGLYHTLFLSQSGNVYCCGDNSNGQCGHNMDHKIIKVPTMISSQFQYNNNNKTNNNIIAICCGGDHNLVLDSFHNLWVFGNNDEGQLGVHNNNNNNNIESNVIYSPKMNPYFNDINCVKIRCGQCHSLCVDDKGICHLFGSNDFGQIGNGSCDKDQGVFDPYQLKINESIIDAECSWSHNVLLSESNNVITFGYLLTLLNEFRWITNGHILNKPYILDKEKIIGINKSDFVEKVFAENDNIIIIINKHKKCKI